MGREPYFQTLLPPIANVCDGSGTGLSLRLEDKLSDRSKTQKIEADAKEFLPMAAQKPTIRSVSCHR